MSSDRFARQRAFFGDEGQRRINEARVVVIGGGGLGSHVVQQLSLLGVLSMTVADPDELDATNRNRLVGARHDDPIPGTPKVAIATRVAHGIDPTVTVAPLRARFPSPDSYAAIGRADYVVGCLDREGPRLLLTEVCAAYSSTYIDAATEILPGDPPDYGGRVCVAKGGTGCLVCLDVLDLREASRDLAPEGECRDREAIYGVARDALGGSGPSVVSVNGVVASLAVTEFLVDCVGLREPRRLLTYHGRTGKVTASTDVPRADCWYCTTIWGRRESAGVERYLRDDNERR